MDTLFTTIDSISGNLLSEGIINQESSWFICKISLGEMLTIAIAIMGLIIAIQQYRSSKKETWFLQVIVLPQLELIKKFYLDLFPKLEKDKQQINEWALEAHKENAVKIASLKNQRKDDINDFFDHIVALVRSYDSGLGTKVNDVVMRLEDAYVLILDEYNNQQEVNERSLILENEQELLKELNSGLSRNKSVHVAFRELFKTCRE